MADTPVALTVITSDLLNDLGATDFQDLLDFVPSTDYYAEYGTDTIANNAKIPTQIVVRGFPTTTQTKDFFITQVPADRYLTDSITFTRGPNALLFGIGNPGGTVGVTSNRAQFKGEFGQVEFTYDSLSSKRTSIDQNIELIKDRVAIRADLLLERKNLFRVPTGQNKEGVFLTATIHPFNNDQRTSMIVSYEAGTRDDVSARPFAPFDGFSTWIANGAPLYNNLTAAAPPTVLNASTPYTSVASQYVNILGQNSILPFLSTVKAGTYNGYVTTTGPIVNGAAVAPATNGGYSINKDFVSLNPMTLLLNYFGGDQAKLSSWLTALGPQASIPESFNKGPAVVPVDTFLSGPNDRYTAHWNIPRLIVDHRLGRDFDVELAGNVEQFDDYNRVTIRGTDYTIHYDPNLYLPGGAPNPYAGVPYISNDAAFATTTYDTTTAEEARFSTNYRLDLSEHKFLGMSLGKYSFSTLANVYNLEVADYQTRPYVTSVNGVPVALGTVLNQGSYLTQGNVLHSRYYLLPGQPPYIPASDPLTPLPVTSPIQADWVNLFGSRTRTAIQSYAASLEARYFDDRLILVGGVRYDWARTWNSAQVDYTAQTLTPGAYPGEANLPATFATLYPATNYRVINYSGGMVYHLTNWFSPFVNYATNSNPGAVAAGTGNAPRDIFLNLVPYLQGKGTDFGFKFSFLQGNLQGSYTHYTTSQDNVTGSTPSITGSIYTSANADMQLAEPAYYAQRSVTFPGQIWSVDWNQVTKGDEVDLTYNLTNHLRLRLAGSDQKTITAGKYEDVGRFLAIHEPIWQAYAADPTTSAANAATVLNSIPVINNELAAYQAQNGAPQIGDSTWSASLSAHYSFDRSTWLRGFGVGANISVRGPVVLGYQVNQNGSVNLNNTDYGSGPRYINLNLDYSRPILHGKYLWSIYAQLTNAFGDSTLIPRQAIWDYNSNRFDETSNTIQDPRTLTVTARFKY